MGLTILTYLTIFDRRNVLMRHLKYHDVIEFGDT